MPATDIIKDLAKRFDELWRSPRLPQEKESLERELESRDGRIDRLVYELYGLSEDEIKIVEGQ